MATVVRAERNYESGRWVTYDRQFRRQALARKSLDWSVTDPRLYSEAFTGRAKSIPRCSTCLEMTTSPPASPRTLTALGGHGLQAQHRGLRHPLVHSRVPCSNHAGFPKSAAASMRAGAECLPAGTFIPKVCNGSHPAIQCGRIRQRDCSPPRGAAHQNQGQPSWARH